MLHKTMVFAIALIPALSLSAAEKQLPVKPPAIVQTAPVQLNDDVRRNMEISRMNQQIADLRQQVGALQQDLAKLRADHRGHYHTAMGSFVPVEEIVNNKERYRGQRLWVVSPDASVSSAKNR